MTLSADITAEPRPDFPILQTKLDDGTSISYLDNAATTHKPVAVLEATEKYYYTANANVGRSVHASSMRATDAYEGAREEVRAFVNAEQASEVVFTKNTTEAINLVALAFERLVSAGDEVVISGMEHHSNLLPWLKLCERTGATLRPVPLDEAGRFTLETFRNQLSERTRLVAIAHVSNVLGTVNPVKELIAEAHRHNIPVLIDGAQAVAHRAVDVRDLDADFYCFSAHKMYGPMGVGVLYGKTVWLERLESVLTGGGVARSVSLQTGQVVYLPLPNRLEAGTPNIGGAVGLAAATRYLRGIGFDRVTTHDTALTARLVERLDAIDNVRLLGGPGQPEGAIVTFAVDGLHPYDVGNQLSARGYMVRTGVHCAVPMTDHLGLVGTVRASFGIYNTPEEVDGFAEVLRHVEPGFWTKEHPNERFL